jgi:hypothetical protein
MTFRSISVHDRIEFGGKPILFVGDLGWLSPLFSFFNVCLPSALLMLRLSTRAFLMPMTLRFTLIRFSRICAAITMFYTMCGSTTDLPQQPTDMPQQRTEPDQQPIDMPQRQTYRNNQQTSGNNEQNRINNKHAATTNRHAATMSKTGSTTDIPQQPTDIR